MSRYYFVLILIFLVGCSKSKIEPIEEKEPLFTLLKSEKTGVIFNNKVSENLNNFFGVYNYAYNGGGVAVGDINNDGLADIYFTGNQVEDKLYLNKGNFTFEDITKKAGILNKTTWHNGVVMADVNADGLLDIYICKGGWNDQETLRENLLYINKGDNSFIEQAAEFGLGDNGYSMMASFFDADNDNDLDMYLVNRPKDFFIPVEAYKKMKDASIDVYRDKLYINDGGKFVEKSKVMGITNNLGNGLGLVTSDVNNDGYTDIFVANDYYENDYLYINKGEGIFNDEIKKSTNHNAFYGMGVDIVDINNDGMEDIIELDMSPEDYTRSKTNMASMNTKEYKYFLEEGFYNQYMHNMLFLNQGKSFFSDISQLSGISKTDWSWSCLGSDFDNDGYKDIFITNGFKRDIWNRDASLKYQEYSKKGVNPNKSKNQIIKEIVDFFPSNKLENYIFKNNGDLRFKNVSKEWGIDIPSFSNGATTADLDNDGDLDLIVNNIDDKAFIYKNNSEKLANTYLKIKLIGPEENTKGLGAKITLFYNKNIQYQEFKTVRGYLSSVEPIVHFGLGKNTKIDSLRIVWNTDEQQIIKDVETNQQITITHKDAEIRTKTIQTKNNQLLTDITNKTFKKPVLHIENEYDDYAHQILLPHKLSTSGPSIAIGDANNDGLDDFYIGGSKDEIGRLFIQSNDHSFIHKKQSIFVKDKAQEDIFAHFFDADNDNDLDLYVVSGGNEFESENIFYTDRLYINNGKGAYTKSTTLPEIKTSGSCVIPLDFDKDGDLDLFIGNRHVPRKYPISPPSFILENKNGQFIDITATVAPDFKDLGMVTSAISANIDNDPDEELLIVGEWMKIHVFKYIDGKYTDITEAWGLEKTHGWWSHIEADDIDKDGDIDFVVGNLGLNYKFKASLEKPFYVFANDYDQNGTHDVFLAKKLDDKLVPIRGKECSSEQLPHLQEKFKSYQEFANAELFDIIGKNQESAIQYKAETFASVLLLNNNGNFSVKELPIEAQFSIINGIVIDDFNKDGFKDIVIGGNRFNVEIETTRSDASIGLVLLGSETGEFKPVTSLESGLFIPENVKSLKKIRLSDKKMGILVGVNDGALKLYTD